MLKENGDKLPEDDKKKLEEAIEKAKKEIESTDVQVIKNALEELQKVSNEVFTKMYQNANPNGNNTDTNTDPNGGNNTDGDPEVVVD